jgi:hypothetical protein
LEVTGFAEAANTQKSPPPLRPGLCAGSQYDPAPFSTEWGNFYNAVTDRNRFGAFQIKIVSQPREQAK